MLVLGQLPFLLKEAEYRLLSTSASDNTRKNISFDPATGTAHGTALAGEEMALLVAMLDRFGREAESLVRNLFPRYAPKLERARTSFRPAEIAGRAAAPRKDDKRLHVDAFPTRPMGAAEFCGFLPMSHRTAHCADGGLVSHSGILRQSFCPGYVRACQGRAGSWCSSD